MDRREQTKTKTILIGVQSRTNSTRLPGKATKELGGKALIEWVMDAAVKASDYLNRNFSRYQCLVRPMLLIPWGDPLGERYGRKYSVGQFEELSEWDVLGRYIKAAKGLEADYVVRLTGDCASTASYLVSRCTKTAVFRHYDYVSNVLVRTFREGMDVEVISNRLLQWLDERTIGGQREHVTSILQDRDNVPSYFRFCHILNEGIVDDSDKKTSIDTLEDFNNAVAEIDSCMSKRRRALQNGDAAE